MQIQTVALEVLINSYQITHNNDGDAFEFILNEDLYVMECVRLKSLYRGVSQSGITREIRQNVRRRMRGDIKAVQCSPQSIDGALFELNHVRVNPELDNTFIIKKLTDTLNQIGVKVSNQPRKDSMAICYKPLGEISDNVRFYMDPEGKLVFLSPSTRPRLVYSKRD